jgi:two-component system, OmpR family, KDP operon response regulator KdpE
MLKKYRILVADDDARLRESLFARLTAAGYDVINAGNGTEALEQAQVQEPDMLILDILMSGMDGLQVLHELRKYSVIPVIVLSTQNADITRIKTLNLGADDYLAKPFNVDELIARIEAVRRRLKPGSEEDNSMALGDITIDFKRKALYVNNTAIKLTLIEWQLISELAVNRGRLIQYDRLLAKVWGKEYRDDIQLLRTWISRLRKKLETDPDRPLIHTVRNTGYILEYQPDDKGNISR